MLEPRVVGGVDGWRRGWLEVRVVGGTGGWRHGWLEATSWYFYWKTPKIFGDQPPRTEILGL